MERPQPSKFARHFRCALEAHGHGVNHGHVGCWLPTKIHADCLAVAYPLLLPFWLRHVLRATAACNFWSLSWPDVSAPATLASPLFECPEPQNIGKKNTVLRGFSTFSRALIFFLLTLSLLTSFFLLFSSLTALTSAFPSVHIVGSLTSKLPSPISTTYPCLEDHWDWECFNCWGCNIVTLWETDDWIWLGPPCLYIYIYTLLMILHSKINPQSFVSPSINTCWSMFYL